MPVILIVIGLAVILGLGSYMLRPEDATAPTAEVVIPDTEKEVVTIPQESTSTPNPETVTTDPAATPETKPAVTTPTTPVVTTPTEPIVTAPTETSTYADGVHTVTTAYTAPGSSNHTVTVSLTLTGDVVTNSFVSYGGDKVSESSKYQNRFSNSYTTSVVGKSLDSIKLSRVGGASLTTGAFNAALTQIKTEAKI